MKCIEKECKYREALTHYGNYISGKVWKNILFF